MVFWFCFVFRHCFKFSTYIVHFFFIFCQCIIVMHNTGVHFGLILQAWDLICSNFVSSIFFLLPPPSPCSLSSVLLFFLPLHQFLSESAFQSTTLPMRQCNRTVLNPWNISEKEIFGAKGNNRSDFRFPFKPLEYPLEIANWKVKNGNLTEEENQPGK